MQNDAMEKVINIRTLIGTEARLRPNADLIRQALKENEECHVIDFDGVNFVSRSFADELCNILDENNQLRLTNESPLVKRMIDVVLASRKRVRTRDDDEEIVKLTTMDELEKFVSDI